MAQDEEGDDDKLPPLGAGTEKFLDDAKKGKPRSFLLICKGSKVRYLAVKKKPVKSTELNDAKKQGYKGVGYFGVITGQSLNLVFNLARSDGYDKEPVKEKALKEFLEEHAGLKAKPTFAIVDSPPAIPFDEEDLANPLVARFMAMDQAISQAIDTQPDRASELLAGVTAIRGLLQDGNFNSAGPKIDELATLLEGTQVPSAPPPASAASPPMLDSEMARFTSRLKALKPSIDPAIAAKDARGEEIKLCVSEAAVFARKKEFGPANQMLDQVETLLKPTAATVTPTKNVNDPEPSLLARLNVLTPRIKEFAAAADAAGQAAGADLEAKKAALAVRNRLLTLVRDCKGMIGTNDEQAKANLAELETLLGTMGGAPGKPSEDLAAAFTARLKGLKPSLVEALANPNASPYIKLKVSEAGEFARKQDFAQADMLLDQVETLLKATKPQPANGNLSLVKLGKARIEWNSLRSTSVGELERLKGILQDEYAEDADEKQTLGEAFKKIDGMIGTLNEELGDQLDDVLNGDAVERPKLIAKAKATLDRFVNFVEKDELMQSVDGNEYAEDMQVAAPIGAKLQEIAAALGH